MAITIRKMDEIRPVLDWYKKRMHIKTDAGALTAAIDELRVRLDEIEMLYADLHKMSTRAETAERILMGLEEHLRPALEIIQQRELEL